MPDIQMAPYVLGAYVVAWLVLSGYLGYLGVKIARLKQEVAHLSDTARRTPPSS